MVYMDVSVGAVFLYIHAGWGSFRCMCWFHGHMIPTSCGSDWPGLVFCCVFVLLKSRVLFRKCIAKLLSAHMRGRTPVLEYAGKLYHNVLKRVLSISCFKSPSWGNTTHKFFLAFLCHMVHRAIKISFPLSSAHSQACVWALPPLWGLWAAFQCDKTMMSFGRICQDRLILGQGWRVYTQQGCKMILFEAFH